MSRLLLICLLGIAAWAAVPVITPVESIEINGTAKDMVLSGKRLLVATDMGHIEVHDIESKKKITVTSVSGEEDEIECHGGTLTLKIKEG